MSQRTGNGVAATPYRIAAGLRLSPHMRNFFVVAHRATPTNTRLGTVLTPARALARLRRGDVALGRLDVLRSLDGIEPGLWALGRLAELGATVLNGRPALVNAHDKLATAAALDGAGVPIRARSTSLPGCRHQSSTRRSS